MSEETLPGEMIGGGAALADARVVAGAPAFGYPRGPTLSRRRSLGLILSRLFTAAEWSTAAAGILLLSGAIVPLVLSGSMSSSELSEGHPLFRALFAVIYALAAFFAVFRWKTFLSVVLRDKAVVLLITFAALSVAWSVSPDVTLRRSIALILTTAFAWYLVTRYDRISMLRLFGASLGFALVLSFATAVALPQYGIASGVHEGAWQGVYSHKNLLGKAAALSALVFLLLWRSDRRTRVASGAGLLLAVGLVLLSRSLTSLVVLAGVLAIFPFVSVLRWRFSRAAPVLTAMLFLATGAALVLATNVEEALAAFGRDTTLTGRTALWLAVLEVGMNRAMLGAGYTAFWGSSDVDLVQDMAGWNAMGAHNGFLDLWLDLGAVGVALLGLVIVVALTRAFRSLRASTRPEAVWPVLGIMFVLLASVTEGGLMRQNNLVWVTFVAASASALRTDGRAPALTPNAD